MSTHFDHDERTGRDFLASLAWWCAVCWPVTLVSWLCVTHRLAKLGHPTTTAILATFGSTLACTIASVALESQLANDREGRTRYFLVTLGIVALVGIPTLPVIIAYVMLMSWTW